ncbi:interactor of constitutive active ROPs 2, chloroplastic [Dorcoceras hygrometricum]|uniref:Interactor of constitutive active ROPs 2, chloroplastic n=1 Tax=Dorcoceras hygrometricum TaxID=472368 RepID=A0A2Z7CXC0_9LAMI|nr:interactor of constitutive active ROPs 2, chloroplastic [Dorcoceras hygrometricum]
MLWLEPRTQASLPELGYLVSHWSLALPSFCVARLNLFNACLQPNLQKKRSSRDYSELESQFSQLQDDLKKAKEQLSSSESWKTKARQEAEEAQRQLTAMTCELEETRKQLKELSDSEEARVQELRKISQDRDRAWQSELEAVQKQHLMDSAALASAMNEMHKLKIQLDRVSESEASQARHAESAHAEIQSLRFELTETLDLVEKLKNQLNDSRESEDLALEEVSQVQMQLDVMKSTKEMLQSEHANTMESYKALLLELEQLKDRENSSEGLVSNHQADLSNRCKFSADSSDDVKISLGTREDDESGLLEAELINTKHEASQLRAALEAADCRYREEYLRSTLQIRNAYELVERTRSDSCKREAELEERLQASMIEVEGLRGKLIENKNELFSASCVNKGLNAKMEESKLEVELKNSESTIQNLTSSLLEKETRLQNLTEENEMLKSEILKREKEKNKANNDALASAESARAAEQEALKRLGYLTEDAEKNRRKAANVTEQLDAAQAAYSEMEADLRRLKVQSDQWRKAAEVAAAMLSNGDNDKYIERTRSLEYNMIGGKWGSPCSDDTDDESPKKKNSNMLKKIGVLLKKGQK